MALDGTRTLTSSVTGTIELSGAEIVAVLSGQTRAFVTSGDGLLLVDFSDPANPTLIQTIDPSANSASSETGINSVAVNAAGLVAVAYAGDDEQANGEVQFYNADGVFQGAVTVGPLPDSVAFNDAGTHVVVANEGESAGDENEPDATPNPNGSVSIITVNAADPSMSVVNTFDFTDASITAEALAAKDVRINPNAPSVAADIEPEFVTLDGNKAFITLQENNAVARIEDITTFDGFTVDNIIGLGVKDHSVEGAGLDASNRDAAINIDTYDIVGLYMPDSIDTYVTSAGTFFLTANEGDGRDVDESRGADLIEDNLVDASIGDELLAQLADDAVLGRLKFSNVDGDTDGDGDIDVLHAFGARSFSIFDEEGNLVFDSGDDFEQFTAIAIPDRFNSDEGDPDEFDDRSDDKGPEPEAVTIGQIGDQVFAFVGLERVGGVMVYDITDPTDVKFDNYIRNDADVGPEGLAFISSSDSPTDAPLLVTSSEDSNTLTFHQIDDAPEVFTLELLHFADQEASTGAIVDAPNLSAVLAALQAEDLGDDGLTDKTLVISSGDAFIPGVFFDASASAFGVAGLADFQIQNELGIDAITLGNHEFDAGPELLASLISGEFEDDGDAFDVVFDQDAFDGTDLEDATYGGTIFPYLSANLDFSTSESLGPLAIDGGRAPEPNVVTSSTIIAAPGDINEFIGVVGATTPTLASISSPGDLTISPAEFDTTPTDAQLDALAAEIQAEVDALLEAFPGLNKVILSAHMQQFSIEQGLAERLTDVDIIIAGGSNTRLFDENDRPRDGDSAQGEYPIFVENAGGSTTAVVNTDGSYKYVGRLVIDFDENGEIITDSYDAEVSGAFATDSQGVADLNAGDLVDPEIQAIVDVIEDEIIAAEGNVFGVSDVFLNGNRSGDAEDPADPDGVRTQETNLGNLTADANLAIAQEADETVLVSIKNGGGIRASIGEDLVPAGGTESVRTANSELTDSEGNVIKPEGGISQTDIQATLAFNNDLVLLTLTHEELVAVLEHGVSALPNVAGQFPQIAGLKFSFDPDLEAGSRIQSAAIFDGDDPVKELVRDGEIVTPDASVRIVTLGFLASPRFDDEGNFTGGGDGYPFPNTDEPEIAARVNPVGLEEEGVQTGDATFADNGTEQDALAEFLLDNFNGDDAFDFEDTGRDEDGRIQNLNFREDDVLDGFNPFEGGDDDDEFIGGNDAETLSGGGGDDDISGGGGGDSIDGGEGEDNAFGGRGADMIDGGAGNDTATGGRGADTIDGGVGDDVVRGGFGRDDLSGGVGDDLVSGGRGRDVLDGGAGDDTLIGGRGRDELDGGAGADELRGGRGADDLDGGVGDDLLIGGGGFDDLDGGAGDDTLTGGQGADDLTGGEGADVFRFNGAAGFDEITDFEQGVDMIEITGGANGFDDLSIRDGQDGARIFFAGALITATGQIAADFTADDFFFS